MPDCRPRALALAATRQGQGNILDPRADVNWKFGWRDLAHAEGETDFGERGAARKGKKGAAQPPVTLMWRESAGR